MSGASVFTAITGCSASVNRIRTMADDGPVIKLATKKSPCWLKDGICNHDSELTNGSHHPARASKATMSKTADRVLGVHGFVLHFIAICCKAHLGNVAELFFYLRFQSRLDMDRILEPLGRRLSYEARFDCRQSLARQAQSQSNTHR